MYIFTIQAYGYMVGFCLPKTKENKKNGENGEHTKHRIY